MHTPQPTSFLQRCRSQASRGYQSRLDRSGTSCMHNTGYGRNPLESRSYRRAFASMTRRTIHFSSGDVWHSDGDNKTDVVTSALTLTCSPCRRRARSDCIQQRTPPLYTARRIHIHVSEESQTSWHEVDGVCTATSETHVSDATKVHVRQTPFSLTCFI